MNHLLCLLLSLAGFWGLCLGASRHRHEFMGRKLSPRAEALLTWGGWLALALAFVVAMRGFGAGLGSVVWTGWLTIAAFLVVGALTWRAGRKAATAPKQGAQRR